MFTRYMLWDRSLHELTSRHADAKASSEKGLALYAFNVKEKGCLARCLCTALCVARDVLWEWVYARGVHEFGRVCLLPETQREPVHIYIHQANHPRYGTSQHSTSHNGPAQGAHMKAISVRSSQDSSTRARQHKRPTPRPGRLSCRRGQLRPPAHASSYGGVDVGLGIARPWPWPSSCHCPASLATPVWRGRPPRV